MIAPTRTLPELPLLLWNTPIALQTILEQEGVAFRVIRDAHPLALRAGRFVLFDSRSQTKLEMRPFLKPEHVLIDIRELCNGESIDPFEALLENRGRATSWRLVHHSVTETVARFDRARIRRRLITRLRDILLAHDGIWARIAPFPHPYRAAFNLRVDLDECVPEDYFAFAGARDAIADATTHFVSTHAYGTTPAILADLKQFDTHSHAHYHVIYREDAPNRVNLRRALDTLHTAGIEGMGFASPHGKWNAGLNQELEELGHTFSSEFQVGYDDLPFYPWTGSRRGRVIQIPVHPICEGLFDDAGSEGPEAITDHLTAVVKAKISAGEPAFVYGHPERRLGRYPSVVRDLAELVIGDANVWKVGLGPFAEWWKWRMDCSWSLMHKGDQSYQLQVEDWDARYPLALEVIRDRQAAIIPIENATSTISLDALEFERKTTEYSLPAPVDTPRDRSLKGTIRRVIDWETVTPIDDLPVISLRSRIKRELRIWRERSSQAS